MVVHQLLKFSTGFHSDPLFTSETAEHFNSIILKYTGTIALMVPILSVVGGAKAERALVLYETGAM